MKNKILTLVASILLSGCAVGPLVSHETARTVGREKNEFSGGIGVAGYVFKFNHGITENLDLGVQLETLSLSGKLKYAFINNQERGFSLAGAVGIGTSVGGDHSYLDLTASYLNGAVEPYGTLRGVYVHTDPHDFKDTNTGEIAFTIDKSEYGYGQGILGVRMWPNQKWFISVEGSTIFSITSGFGVGHNVLMGVALGTRF